MNSGRAKFVVLAVFVLTLGAGMTAGILAARLPLANSSNSVTTVSAESPLAAQLDLTPEQSAKMQKIWEGVRDISVESLAKGMAAEHARDNAIQELIPSDKIRQFNEIKRKYAETIAAMKGRREGAFEQAVAQTKEILTETQRKKYSEILAKRLGAEGSGEHDPFGGAAVSTPASQPSF